MLVKPQAASPAKIKVVGVGGGGNNAINTMINNYDVSEVEFLAVNTDAQALAVSQAEVKLKIGEEVTRGLGSGGNPAIGRKAAEESVDMIHEHLAGADMVFITCGMGGGTGTGASPVVASVAKNLGALTVGIVTKPFSFEGKRRMDAALRGIDELKDKVDTLLIVPNQRLLEIIDRNISFIEAMKKVDDVLAQAVMSISDLVNQAGMINVDFADVKSVMSNAGTALMGIGSSTGDDRAREAAKAAIASPLLELSIDGAKGVLFNVIGGNDMSMFEIDEAAKLIYESVDPGANIIFGASIDPNMKDEVKITVLATGFDMTPQQMANLGLNSRPGGFQQQRQPSPIARNEAPAQAAPSSTQANPVSHTPPQQRQEQQNRPTNAENFGNLGGNMYTGNTSSDDDLDTPSFMRRRKSY